MIVVLNTATYSTVTAAIEIIVVRFLSSGESPKHNLPVVEGDGMRLSRGGASEGSESKGGGDELEHRDS